MTTEAEKAAEEYADKSKDDLYRSQSPHFKRAIDPELNSLLWIAEKMAFEAGYNHALTPRKIDPNDENSWPPERFLLSHDLISWRATTRKSMDWNIAFNKSTDDFYWLPPAPEGER